MSSCNSKPSIDLIVFNATIHTVDDEMNQFSAMAVHDGKIVALGSQDELLQHYEAKTSIDLEQAVVFPGFIDPHCHFLGYGNSLFNADLVGTTSFNDVLDKLAQHQEKYPSDWVRGRGWDQNDWEVKDFPTKERLDKLYPDQPVYMKRIDGHAVLVNQKVLDMAGYKDGHFPENLVPLKKGKSIGILIDEAMDNAFQE